jgi:hypothetical protein
VAFHLSGRCVPGVGGDFDKRGVQRTGRDPWLAVVAAPPFQGVRFEAKVAGDASQGQYLGEPEGLGPQRLGNP